MKKHMLVFGVVVFLLMGIVPSSPAAEDNAFTKFGRGVANIVIAPAELYAQPLLLSKDNEPAVAIFGGILKGISMFVVREVVGLYEVVTFPIPLPQGYKPVLQPATTFTDWDTRYGQNS